MELLSLNNLHSDYQQDGKQLNILNDLSLTLKTGELCALLGPSGCGKTTLMRCIAGFQKSTGSIKLQGKNINDKAVAQRDIGFVFQDYALFPHLTVFNNIAYGLHKKTKFEQHNRVDELLELIQLKHLAQRYPHELSGGQQQRIALARALAPRPKLLLLDEPFSNLDSDLRKNLSLSVRETLKASGVAAILVTHDQTEAFAFGDRIGIVNKGKVEQMATPYTLYYQPETPFVAEFIGQGKLIKAQVIDASHKHFTTAFGNIPFQNNLSPGSYQLLTRPDDWQFSKEGCSATILAKQFIGRQTIYHVERDKQSIAITVPSVVNASIGDTISIKPCFEHIITFEEKNKQG